VSTFDDQLEKVRTAAGFIAALDQSGGSTPKALQQYGIPKDAWSGDDEMLVLVHEMRTRIVTSPAFGGDRILGAILFEGTMDRDIKGVPSPEYLWQMMKPMPGLDLLLERAKAKGVFGTKERSVVKEANAKGVAAIVRQQFDVAKQVLAHGLVPIIEPEIDIKCPDKAAAEKLLRKEILAALDELAPGRLVMLKLTLPEEADFYRPCIEHRNVLKVVALSGGYSRDEANARLARNHGIVASFSRALVEGLVAEQSAEEFNGALDRSMASIFAASMT